MTSAQPHYTRTHKHNGGQTTWRRDGWPDWQTEGQTQCGVVPAVPVITNSFIDNIFFSEDANDFNIQSSTTFPTHTHMHTPPPLISIVLICHNSAQSGLAAITATRQSVYWGLVVAVGRYRSAMKGRDSCRIYLYVPISPAHSINSIHFKWCRASTLLRRSGFFCPTACTVRRLKGLKPYQDQPSLYHPPPEITRRTPLNITAGLLWPSNEFTRRLRCWRSLLLTEAEPFFNLQGFPFPSSFFQSPIFFETCLHGTEEPDSTRGRGVGAKSTCQVGDWSSSVSKPLTGCLHQTLWSKRLFIHSQDYWCYSFSLKASQLCMNMHDVKTIIIIK